MPVTAQLLFIAFTMLNKHVSISPLPSLPLTITMCVCVCVGGGTLKLLQALLKISASITPTVPHQQSCKDLRSPPQKEKALSALKAL